MATDRNSKLTALLADALGDNAKAFLFAHVAPLDDNTAESLSTLTFAKRASEVTLGTPVKRVVRDSSSKAQKLELAAAIDTAEEFRTQAFAAQGQLAVVEAALEESQGEVLALQEQVHDMSASPARQRGGGGYEAAAAMEVELEGLREQNAQLMELVGGGRDSPDADAAGGRLGALLDLQGSGDDSPPAISSPQGGGMGVAFDFASTRTGASSPLLSLRHLCRQSLTQWTLLCELQRRRAAAGTTAAAVPPAPPVPAHVVALPHAPNRHPRLTSLLPVTASSWHPLVSRARSRTLGRRT